MINCLLNHSLFPSFVLPLNHASHTLTSCRLCPTTGTAITNKKTVCQKYYNSLLSYSDTMIFPLSLTLSYHTLHVGFYFVGTGSERVHFVGFLGKDNEHAVAIWTYLSPTVTIIICDVMNKASIHSMFTMS